MEPSGAGATAPPQLLLKSIQGNAIRTLFEVLKEIVHDVSLRIDSTGVKLLTLDGARCALVYMRLRADAFEEFRCEGTYNLGVNMASMFKLVKTSGSHDTITLYMDTDMSNELGIKIQNAEKNSVTDFKLKLLDIDDEIITLPDVEFDSVITMPSSFFQRLCRDMLNISDTMVIKSTGNQLVLGCNGDFARQVSREGAAGHCVCWKSRTTPPPPLAGNHHRRSRCGHEHLGKIGKDDRGAVQPQVPVALLQSGQPVQHHRAVSEGVLPAHPQVQRGFAGRAPFLRGAQGRRLTASQTAVVSGFC